MMTARFTKEESRLRANIATRACEHAKSIACSNGFAIKLLERGAVI